MNQLDKRLCKLEQVMGKRPPRLERKSAQECLELLRDAFRSDPARKDTLLQGISTAISEEQLRGIINIFRAQQGLPPEPPPLGTCTIAQIREHYPDFYKSLSAEKRAQAQRPDEEM